MNKTKKKYKGKEQMNSARVQGAKVHKELKSARVHKEN